MAGRTKKRGIQGVNPEKEMDWAGIEPAASSMPRKRSTTDLPARSYLLGCHRLKELFMVILLHLITRVFFFEKLKNFIVGRI
jgi:hypothetical protein